jgi:hypothetical protein
MAGRGSPQPKRGLPDARTGTDAPPSVKHDLAERDRAARADDQVADDRDGEARTADTAANARDLAAMQRDFDADIEMVGQPLTTTARRAQRDREAAALDRASAVDDRGRARRDRKIGKHGRVRASGDRDAAMEGVAYLRRLLNEAEDNAEDMLVIGQAQGTLMQHGGVGAAEALIAVAARAAKNQNSLKYAALDIVGEDSHEPGPRQRTHEVEPADSV